MHLHATGMKARDIDVTLSQRSLLAAPCGSGKSTVADAIRFVLLGFVPYLGKRPADTAALMRGREMAVELTLDDGRTVRRTLRRAARGLASHVECSWLADGSTQEQHHVAAVALIGGDEAEAEESLDIRALLNATPNQRTARIESLLAAGGLSVEDRLAVVAEFTVRRLTGSETRDVEDWTVLKPLIDGSGKGPDGGHVGERAALVAHQKMLAAKLTEVGIAGACTWANDEKRQRNAAATKKRQAREELEARLSDEAEPDEQSIADLEARWAQLEQDLGGIRSRNASLQKRFDEFDAVEDRLDSAIAAHKRAVERRQRCSEAATEKGRAEARLSEIAAEIARLEADAPKAPDLTEADDLAERARKIRAELGQPSLFDGPTIEQAEAKRREFERIEREIAAAGELPWAKAVEHVEAIRALLPGKSPRLTAVYDHLAGIRSLAAANGMPDVAALRDRADVIRAEADQLAQAADKAEVQRAKEREKRSAAEAQAIEFETSARRLRTDKTKEYQDATATHVATLTNLQREQRQIQDALNELAATTRTVDQEIARAEATVAEAQKSLQALGEDVPQKEDESAIVSELAAVQAGIRESQQRRARFAELRAICAELELAEAERNVFSAIEWACQRAREEEVTEAGGALVRLMERFLAAAGRSEKPFFRAGKGQCDIGWVRDGAEVLIQVQSGGEWVLFAAALAAAVITIRGVQLPILLVEAGETDLPTLEALLSGVESMEGLHAVVAVQREAKRLGWRALVPAAATEKQAA